MKVPLKQVFPEKSWPEGEVFASLAMSKLSDTRD